MNSVSEQDFAQLSRAKKMQILQWLIKDFSDDFPGIESNPQVCGGAACIVRTRIPVWVLENARRLGTSEADLRRDYPSLTTQDFANVWAYVRSNREEIGRTITENESNF